MSVRKDGINVRLDRETHAKIVRLAALLTVSRGKKVGNATVISEAISAATFDLDRPKTQASPAVGDLWANCPAHLRPHEEPHWALQEKRGSFEEV